MVGATKFGWVLGGVWRLPPTPFIQPKLPQCAKGGMWPHGMHGVAHHVAAPLAPACTLGPTPAPPTSGPQVRCKAVSGGCHWFVGGDTHNHAFNLRGLHCGCPQAFGPKFSHATMMIVQHPTPKPSTTQKNFDTPLGCIFCQNSAWVQGGTTWCWAKLGAKGTWAATTHPMGASCMVGGQRTTHRPMAPTQQHLAPLHQSPQCGAGCVPPSASGAATCKPHGGPCHAPHVAMQCPWCTLAFLMGHGTVCAV